MSGTTDIDQLPLMNSNQQDGGHAVQMQVSEMNQPVDASIALKQLEMERDKITATQNTQGNQQQMSQQLTQNETNAIMSGINQASQGGMLSLPSRDIPMEPSKMKMDQESHVNYIPQQNMNQPDYIGNTQTADEIIMHHNSVKARENTIDTLFEELQTPILIGIIYFIFSIPSVRTFLFRSFPSLLNLDGNPTTGGIFYVSIVFGGVYYVINKLLKHFSAI